MATAPETSASAPAKPAGEAAPDAATASEAPAAPAPGSTCAEKPARAPPPIGSRIEVLWDLEAGEGDTANTTSHWWGAVVQASEPPASPNLPPTHILLYDAFGEFGEDVARVHFGAEGSLTDLARTSEPAGGELSWRVEGTGSDAGEDARDVVYGVDLNDDAHVLSMLVGDETLRALAELPPAEQIEATAQYRAFADVMKGKLRSLYADRGAGYVVTPEDVRAIFADIKRERGAGVQDEAFPPMQGPGL